MRPILSVNTDARRRGFAHAAVAGYLTRWAAMRGNDSHRQRAAPYTGLLQPR